MRQLLRKKSVRLADSERAFTVVEVLASLFVITILLTVTSTVVSTSGTVNRRTTLRSEVAATAFQKIQDYVNTDYSAIPIGLVGSNYEVEDFSAAAEAAGFANASAKVFVKPASVVNSGTTTTTTNFDETVVADSTSSSGGEISAIDEIDPTSCCRRDWRMTNTSVTDLYYNNFEPGSSNQPLGGIDLGSPQAVSTIRINWYSGFYTSQNFRIEGSNDGTNWNTVASGLSTTTSVGTSIGNYPEDYSVSGTYRYWRMWNVTGQHPTWIAISQFEAFSANASDLVEEDAGSGTLDTTSSDLDITQQGGGGQNIVGVRFKNVPVDQGLTIDNAYIQFTADESDSGSDTFTIQGVDTDSAATWSGNGAVSSAIAGAGGTSATTTWSPGAWNAGDAGAAQQAPVTSIVQEILNRGGWVNGNDMAFAISYASGSNRRVAERDPQPELVIEWSETTTTSTGGDYVDLNMDGDADNPTLLEVTVVIEYDAFGERREVEYTSLIREFGIGT